MDDIAASCWALPASLMGVANLIFGLYGAMCLMTVPQLLAARGARRAAIGGLVGYRRSDDPDLRRFPVRANH